MFKTYNDKTSEIKHFGSGYTMQSFQDFCDSLPLGEYTVYFTGTAAQEILNIGSNYSLGEIFKRGNIDDPQVLVRVTPYYYGLPIYYLERNPAWSYKWQSEVHTRTGGGNKCSAFRRFFEGGGINVENYSSNRCVKLSVVSKQPANGKYVSSRMPHVLKTGSKLRSIAFRHMESAAYCNIRVFGSLGGSHTYRSISRYNDKKSVVRRNFCDCHGSSSVSHLREGVAA